MLSVCPTGIIPGSSIMENLATVTAIVRRRQTNLRGSQKMRGRLVIGTIAITAMSGTRTNAMGAMAVAARTGRKGDKVAGEAAKEAAAVEAVAQIEAEVIEALAQVEAAQAEVEEAETMVATRAVTTIVNMTTTVTAAAGPTCSPSTNIMARTIP